MVYCLGRLGAKMELPVHTCGALLHNGKLIIPYGLADQVAGLPTAPFDEVPAAMRYEDHGTG